MNCNICFPEYSHEGAHLCESHRYDNDLLDAAEYMADTTGDKTWRDHGWWLAVGNCEDARMLSAFFAGRGSSFTVVAVGCGNYEIREELAKAQEAKR